MIKRKYFTHLYAISCAIILIGCKQTTGNSLPVNWSRVTILSEGSTKIILSNDTDSTKVKYYDHRTIFESPRKLKDDSLKAFFTHNEKDSIFKLSQQIISNPIQLKGGCTDHVGELKIIINYGDANNREPSSAEQSINYSGVCRWDTLSDQTRQLHKILKKKIKWWQQ